MAKNIVKVNEEEIRGYMVGNIPDAIEKEDVIVVEVPAEETSLAGVDRQMFRCQYH